MSPQEQISEKIIKLDQLLAAQNPGMENYLQLIHTNLIQDPSLVTPLKPEEIGIIIKALSKKTQIVIVAASSKVSSAKLKNTTLDDL